MCSCTVSAGLCGCWETETSCCLFCVCSLIACRLRWNVKKAVESCLDPFIWSITRLLEPVKQLGSVNLFHMNLVLSFVKIGEAIVCAFGIRREVSLCVFLYVRILVLKVAHLFLAGCQLAYPIKMPV